MGLTSFFRKKPPEPDTSEGAFFSRSEEESGVARGRTKSKPSKKAAEQIDPVLPEKKRARRRLVGAVALVLAAVIGLPMVLDSDPRPLGDDVLVQIPSKDSPARATQPKTASDAPAANLPQGAALDKSEEIIEPGAATPASVSKIAVSADESKPKEASVAVPVKPVEKPAVKPAPEPKPKPELKSEPKPEPKPDSAPAPAPADGNTTDSARAMAILDGSSASAAKVDKKAARLIVQVAALATKEKVAELQDKLKAAGISSYTQTIGTDAGQRIRVRIGPFSSQEEVDKMRARLSKIGLSGTVVPS
ncbi:SPOR domain-containing protein [Actimicrobium sp. CCI2.3]|nr:SPOR domain-containing protein [Actimicrobium sp. CCI2.3]MDY7574259.1 SPOR domain-containing protein [Actimicrobium sp. CCI2.3]MEB0022741.1 SPOR domain-containing protein [Actimicrobium sp. CCI2.3]